MVLTPHACVYVSPAAFDHDYGALGEGEGSPIYHAYDNILYAYLPRGSRIWGLIKLYATLVGRI